MLDNQSVYVATVYRRGYSTLEILETIFNEIVVSLDCTGVHMLYKLLSGGGQGAYLSVYIVLTPKLHLNSYLG